MVFFPSYRLMQDVYEVFAGKAADSCEILMQHSNMKEHEREAFLEEFEHERERTLVAFCVMGGIFGEGIDLKNDRLIGAIIVGTGLPHTPFGDIFVSQSKDMEFWGRRSHMMSSPRGGGFRHGSTHSWYQQGADQDGVKFPLIYHGVITTCNGYVYRMGCALLDIDEPWKVKYRTKDYIMAPLTQYECMGDVPNVVFPCATLSDAATGRITIYYGCADTGNRYGIRNRCR